MPAQMNFGIGQVIDPTAGLQRTLSDIGSKVEASKMEDIRKQALAQQAAEAQAQQDYRIKSLLQSGEQAKASLAEQVRSTDIGAAYKDATLQQAGEQAKSALEQRREEALQLAKHQDALRAQQELANKQHRGDVQYERDIASGKTAAALLPLEEVKSTTGIEKSLNEDVYGKMAASINTPSKLSPTKAGQQAWEEYAIKNIPGYDVKKGMAQKALETITPIAMAGPRLMGTAIVKGQEALTPKSQQDIDRARLVGPIPKGVLSRDAFLKDYTAKQEAQQLENQKAAKKVLDDYIKTEEGGKASGVVTEKEVSKLERIPMDVLKGQAVTSVEEYARQHRLSPAQTEGMKRAQVEKLSEIQKNRTAVDIKTIERFQERADTKDKQDFQMKLAKYKQETGDDMSAWDQARMAKTLMETRKLEKEMKKEYDD